MKKLTMILAMASVLIAATQAGAAQVQQRGKQPIYTITINVVARTTKAVNYQHRNGSTTIDFKGTPLMPAARGEAKVESKQGYMEVEVEFDNLQSATRFGPEFLTYVMWAITPEGRATNMGEVILNGTKSKLDVTTELQAFGLVVTAEPHFGVTQPSDVVVMENFVRKDTVGKVEEIDAKYELFRLPLVREVCWPSGNFRTPTFLPRPIVQFGRRYVLHKGRAACSCPMGSVSDLPAVRWRCTG